MTLSVLQTMRPAQPAKPGAEAPCPMYGHAVEWSPYSAERLAIATCQYYGFVGNIFTQGALVCADLADVTVEKVYMDDAKKNEKEFKAKHATGLFPLLETPDGSMIFESAAICKYFAAHAPTSGLLGQTPF